MSGSLEEELEALLERIGFELVTLERGGARRRPLLRLRVDRAGGSPDGRSRVTAEDCARVSREVQAHLAAHGGAEPVLEVSSPGVERPLVKPRDYERFAGRRACLRGYAPLVGDRKMVEGDLVGLADEGSRVVLEADGERIEVPLADITRANLVYRWEEDL
ncbi:MAG: ribosome maturation factor RimP [Gemmatimonadota bacterium]